MKNRTPANWAAMTILALAIVFVAVDLGIAVPFMIFAPGTMGHGPDPDTLRVQGAAGIGVGLIGLAWMVRILRGADPD